MFSVKNGAAQDFVYLMLWKITIIVQKVIWRLSIHFYLHSGWPSRRYWTKISKNWIWGKTFNWILPVLAVSVMFYSVMWLKLFTITWKTSIILSININFMLWNRNFLLFDRVVELELWISRRFCKNFYTPRNIQSSISIGFQNHEADFELMMKGYWSMSTFALGSVAGSGINVYWKGTAYICKEKASFGPAYDKAYIIYKILPSDMAIVEI